jgi:hypothetical protein
MDEEQRLTYSADSPYANRDGFFGNLTEKQNEVLAVLKSWVVETDFSIVDLANYYIHPCLVLLRYLRATDFDLHRTQQLMLNNMKWRIDREVRTIMDLGIEEILNCDVPRLLEVYPHWHCGYDRVGRPVLYKQYGKFEITKAKEMTDLDSLVRYHVWEQEACMLLCKEQSRKLGLVVETITVVIDIKDMQLRQVNRDFLSVIKQIADIDQRLYPETLGALYILNAPALFPVIWKVVRAWIDPKTAEKFHILSRETDWRPVLERDIGIESLPADYGGRSPQLATYSHPYMDVISDLEESKAQVIRNTVGTLEGSRQLSRQDSTTSSQFFDPKGIICDDWLEELEYLDNLRGVETNRAKLDSIASTIPTQPRLFRIFCFKKLAEKSTNSLIVLLTYSAMFYILVALVLLIMSAYVLGNMFWVSELVQWEMWTSVLCVCLAAWLTILNFTGFIGAKYKNRMLLAGYTAVLGLVACIFFILSIVCFAYASNSTAMTNVSKQALSQALPTNVNANEALHRMRGYNLMLGSGCLACAVFSFVPLSVASVLTWKLRDDPHVPPQGKQLRTVLLVSNTLDMMYSFVIIGYSAYAVHYVLQRGVLGAVFALYLVLLTGFALVILTCVGIWASLTKWSWTVRFYKYLIVLVLLALLCDSIQTCALIPTIDHNVDSLNNEGSLRTDGESASNIAIAVKIQLLVSGILCWTACLLEVISLVSASKLSLYMLDAGRKIRARSLAAVNRENLVPGASKEAILVDDELVVVEASPLSILSTTDKFVIVWAIIAGLENIFLRGTYVIFCHFIEQQPTSWLVAVWRSYGQYDSRYVNSNAVVVTAEGVMALVVGPCSLLFAWTLLVRAPQRISFGLVVSILQVYTQVLYYGSVDDSSSVKNVSRDHRSLFWSLFVVTNLIRFVFPILIFVYLWRQAETIIRRAETVQDLTADEKTSNTLTIAVTQTPTASGNTNVLAVQRTTNDASDFAAPQALGAPGLRARTSALARLEAGTLWDTSPMHRDLFVGHVRAPLTDRLVEEEVKRTTGRQSLQMI